MSNYDKGASGERELINILDREDFAVMRAPASGASTSRELPDIIAGNGESFFVFEVKRWNNDRDYEYLTKEEVHDLQFFAESFGAEYYIAVRFDYGSWGFFKADELHETSKNYRVDYFSETDKDFSRILS